MYKWLLCIGAFLGFIAVAAGAFGAHALKNKLAQDMLAAFETGVRYQMYHALAILLVAGLGFLLPGTLLHLSGWLFISGTVVFSGSLYLLTLSGVKVFGAITPIGGLILLLGWFFLFLSPFFFRAA